MVWRQEWDVAGEMTYADASVKREGTVYEKAAQSAGGVMSKTILDHL